MHSTDTTQYYTVKFVYTMGYELDISPGNDIFVNFVYTYSRQTTSIR